MLDWPHLLDLLAPAASYLFTTVVGYITAYFVHRPPSPTAPPRPPVAP